MVAALFFFGVCAASCGASNSLEGAISEEFSLEFDRVEVSKIGCLVRIDYVKERPLGVSVPCRLVIDTEQVEIVIGERIDGEDFLDAVEVSRVALSGGAFPATQRGWIRFGELELEPGETVQGEFEVRFEKEQFDEEHDLSGTFDASLQEPNPIACD